MDDKCVPQLDGTTGIGGSHAADEMIFECLDSPFCCIDTVVIWFHKLPFKFFGLEENFEGCSCLIVCDIEEGLVPFVDKDIEYALKGGDDGDIFDIGDELRKNAIVAIIICDEEILVRVIPPVYAMGAP